MGATVLAPPRSSTRDPTNPKQSIPLRYWFSTFGYLPAGSESHIIFDLGSESHITLGSTDRKGLHLTPVLATFQQRFKNPIVRL